MASIPTPEELMALPPEYLAEDTSKTLLNVTISLTVLTTLVYALFLVSRVFFTERNGWEIWVLPALSYLFCIGLCIISYFLVEIGGAGRHIEYWFITDPIVVTRALQLQTAAEFVYMASCLFPKLSILVLYLRVFTDRKVRIATWIVMGVAIGHLIGGVIASFTICQPFEFKWNKLIDGHCNNLIAAYRYISLPHILTDIAILVLPFSSLYHLQISRKRKIGIFLTFAMGGLGIITSILRFVSFFTHDLLRDPTWFATPIVSYTIVEPSAYFMCSCFPNLRPLLRAIWRKSGLATKASSYYRNASAGTDQSFRNDISLRSIKGNNITSISAPKVINRDEEMDRSHFIRLDESVDVDVSLAHSQRQI